MDVAVGKMTKIEDSVRPKKPKKRLKMWFVISFLLLLLSPVIIVQLIDFTNRNRIYTEVSNMPTQPIAIVFGAGLQRDGRPSWMLTDRLDSAIELYKANKVKSVRIDLSEPAMLLASPEKIIDAVLKEYKNKTVVYWQDEILKPYESTESNFTLRHFLILIGAFIGLRFLYKYFFHPKRRNL